MAAKTEAAMTKPEEMGDMLGSALALKKFVAAAQDRKGEVM